jgi:predicted nuclease of restriction endonuclease-like (RecB) superfamily
VKDGQYKKWIIELKDRIRRSQTKAAMTVNRELLELYWELGREICEKQQKANWGDGLIDQLAKDLLAAFPGVKGFSRRNLLYIKKWYSFYTIPFVQQPVAQLYLNDLQLLKAIPWTHNCLIIKTSSNIKEALFYVQETIKNNWSRAVLSAQIESKLYKRQGKAIHNFQLTLPEPQADLAQETLKNPYNFDFLTLGKEARERDLETALATHIQKFLLELGQGFAYMGRQFPIKVGKDDFFLDLLFYHTRLHCYVIVELKTAEFQPEYAGKLNFYLNIVNAQLKGPGDGKSIGILLCKTPNKLIVDYALDNISGPLGVAEYEILKTIPDQLKGELPTIEELESELSGAEI